EDDQTDYSFNIFELDAASNNSVNDIRELTDKVRFAPQVGQYKVYIIDEVHMLSTGAFNAFLKTLEEPPSHAIFILATTEKHKILPTILSRCQIYDFRRITVDDINLHLKKIAEKEGITYDERSLHLIAQKADGALRDALSIFDRVSSFTQKNITFEATTELLNVLDYNYYFRITDALLQSDAITALTTLGEIIDRGFDLHLFIGGLASHLRDLWMCKDPRTLGLLNVSSDLQQEYQAQASKCTSAWLEFALRHLQEADLNFKRAQQPQLLTELTLLRLAGSQDEEKKNDQPPVKTTGIAQSSAPVKKTPPPQSSPQETPRSQAVKTAPPSPTPPTQEVKSKVETTVKDNAPEEKPKAVKLAPTLGNRDKARRGFSINSTLKSNKEAQDSEVDDKEDVVEKTADFSLSAEHLQQFYRLYIDTKNDGNHTLLYSTLQSLKPVKKDDYIIEITLHSETQRTIIAECQTEMMAYLRDKLGHGAIELHLNVIEQEANTGITTPQEKLSNLLEEHPITQKLIDQLDLKLDY
ncbi:MAG: DNA polymerase III subunit gamma/tau, partial [Cryomorphaceae bacterium]|nr:DNA polymerase III subunit gamma/tau [Cryomorphaceae bacterium]